MVRFFRHTLAMLGTGAVLAGGLAAGTLAAAEYRQAYNVSVSGIRVGVLEIAANVENGAYAASGGIYSRGLAGALFPFTLTGSSTGRVLAATKLQPVSYSAKQINDDRRDISIRYSSGTPTQVSWTPARKVRAHDIEPGQQAGTVDPIAASYLVLKPLPKDLACNRTIPIYDGSKRSKIRINAAQQRGEKVICTGAYSRVAGFSPKQMSEKVDFPFTITYVASDGNLVVDRIEMDSIIGRAVLSRK